LILAAARPHPSFTEPSTNFETLRDELARAEVLPETLDVNRAINMAAKMLAPRDESDNRPRELVIVSDFQRANWASADFSPLAEATNIQFESTAPEAAPANLGLLSAKVRGRNVLGGSSVMEVEIGNYSPAPRDAAVELTLGEATYRLKGTCPAGRRATLTEEIPWRAGGWQWGQAKLIDSRDALPADDLLPVAVEVAARPTYVLLTRQSAEQRPSSSHYLECALVPDSQLGERASAQVVRVDSASANAEALGGADLIVVDHPGKLPAETVSLLAGLIRQGRPVLYVSGEAIDANNLKVLLDAVGAGLRMPVEFTPPPSGQLRRDLFLAAYQKESPPFRVFGDRTSAVVSGLRFAGGLGSRAMDAGLADDVLATFGDGSACMVMASSAQGTLAVINADLGRSNLPTSADVFVPMLQELIQQMLERKSQTVSAVCGEPLVVRIPASGTNLSQLRVQGPDTAQASDSLGELTSEGIGVVWEWPSPAIPGGYRILRGQGVGTRFGAMARSG
jgi:hypothetical protein